MSEEYRALWYVYTLYCDVYTPCVLGMGDIDILLYDCCEAKNIRIITLILKTLYKCVSISVNYHDLYYDDIILQRSQPVFILAYTPA